MAPPKPAQPSRPSRLIGTLASPPRTKPRICLLTPRLAGGIRGPMPPRRSYRSRAVIPSAVLAPRARGATDPAIAFVGPMPGGELGVDLVNLRLQLCVFTGLAGEQLPSQGRKG